MDILRQKATILVNSCDKYSDVWDPFFTLLNKYWPDCPFDIVINTESLSYNKSFPNLNIKTFHLFSPGEKVDYGERMKAHCAKISTEYIITLLDDFFVRSPVDTAQIIRILDYMDLDKKIACCCLVHHYDIHNVRYQVGRPRLDGYSLRPRYCDFNHDMQASIWRREAFISTWKNWESPWEWESMSNIRSFDDGFKYYDKDFETNFPIDYIDYNKGEWSGIQKGKWVYGTVVDLFKKNGIEVDYSIRGFYEDDDHKIQSHGKLPSDIVKAIWGQLRQFRCLGFKRITPVLLFKIKRFFYSRILKRPYWNNYCQYLRHCFYDK